MLDTLGTYRVPVGMAVHDDIGASILEGLKGTNQYFMITSIVSRNMMSKK